MKPVEAYRLPDPGTGNVLWEVAAGWANFLKAVFSSVACVAFMSTTIMSQGQAPVVEGASFFQTKIQPLFEQHCYECHSHSSEKVRAGLFLDSQSGLLQGGDSGPAVIQGNPDASLLIQAVRYGSIDLQMPPRTRLPDEAIADLEEWIRQGALWGDNNSSSSLAQTTGAAGGGFDLEGRRKAHWAWQPVHPTPIPSGLSGTRPSHPVDAFVQEKLTEAGLRAAPEADRRTLLRRLFLILTGMPPTPEQVEAFEADPDGAAFNVWVDRALESTRFGERWARHWQDVVRYSETLGHEFDYLLPNAWRYRDYLIRAFNQDLPYDQFVREHIAGDLLREPRMDPVTGWNESVIATGFYWFAQQVHSPVDVKAYQLELLDNQIDTITRGFQGVTVSCARCHDHKFDAISTQDFYAMYGILESSRYRQADLTETGRGDEVIGQFQAMRRDWTRLMPNGETRVGTGASLQNEVGAATTSNDSGTPSPPDVAASPLDVWRWHRHGLAMKDAEVKPDEFLWNGTENSVQQALHPLISTRKLSRHLHGDLHSPAFTINQRYLHVRTAGKGSRVRVVIENFNIIRAPIYGGVRRAIDNPKLHWVTFDLDMWRDRRVHIEVLDRVVGDLSEGNSSDVYPKDAWFDLSEVIASDDAKPPERPPELADVSAPEEALAILKRIEAVGAEQGSTAWAPAMMDGEGINSPVFIRGNVNRPGPMVPRRFLEALGGLEAKVSQGSGRDVLADLIVDPENPLTARVWVNRVWHQLFGRGLVATVDDFGVLGERPTHPELLDWLSHWFMNEAHWSTKKLVRLLVTSDAWRQSVSGEDPASVERDPENLLLHRWTVRRLEGESIRDSLVFVAGRLDEQMMGPSVPVHLTEFMTGRGRPDKSGPLDGNGRRSIYLELRRNFMPPLLLAFDTPQTAQTFGRRTRSNVPAQALILMNDPLIQRMAADLAERISNETFGSQRDGTGNEEGLSRLFQLALQREPNTVEREAALEFLKDASWEDLCHVVFNLKEFLYIY